MSACAGKTRYGLRLDAELALARIQMKGGDQLREKTPIRSYYCGTCRGWHLTSMPKSEPTTGPGSGNKAVSDAADRVNKAHEELIVARDQLRRALSARAKISARQPAVCGTPSAYRKHKRKRETPCWACLEAYTWDRKRREH